MADFLIYKKLAQQEIIAFIQNDILKNIYVYRQQTLSLNDLVNGKIVIHNPLLRGYFVLTDSDLSVFVPSQKTYCEGQNVLVKITKEARLGKDATGCFIDTAPIVEPTPFSQQISNQFNLPLSDETQTDYRLRDLIDEALEKKIFFADGAELMIERTQALWSIDVDSAKSQLSFEKLNQKAIIEIAHQIILKNLSGVILIDFIGFKTKKEQASLLKSLKSAFQNDTRTKIYGFTSLGLLEIRRTRTTSALADVFLLPDGTKHPLYSIFLIEESLLKTKSGKITLKINQVLQPYLTETILKLAQVEIVPESASDFFEVIEN